MTPRSAGAGHGWRAALALAGVVVALDQASKQAVLSALEPGERVQLIFGFDLVEISNRGIAFGFLGDGGSLVLAVTIGALAAMLAWFALQPSRPGMWIAVGLLTGGALGNLADRVRVDAVTDFLDPPLWPSFNVADVAITLGALALVLSVFWGEEDAGAGP